MDHIDSIAHIGVDAERRQQLADYLENRMARAILGWASWFADGECSGDGDEQTVGDYLYSLSGFDEPLNLVPIGFDPNELAGEVINLIQAGSAELAVA